MVSFSEHDKEDPYDHVRYFNKITSTLKFLNVSNTSIEVMLFPFSLEELHQLDTFYNALNSKDQDSLNSVVGGKFLDKMPRECLAIIESKSKVFYSRNKPVVAKVSMNASTFVDESCVTCSGAHSYRNFPATDGNVYRDNIQEFVSQAFVDNYNQGNTSYRPPMMSNQIRPPGFPLVPNNQNFQRNNQNRFILNQNQGNNFNQGPVYQPSVFQPPAYQAPAYQAPAPQTQGVFKEDFSAYVKANDAVIRNMQTQGQNMQNQLTNLTDLITKFMNSNSASTSSSGTLPSNIIANLRSDLKAITTRSGVSYDGPQIPPPTPSLPKVVEDEPEATKDTVVEDEPEATKDTVNPTNNKNTKDVQPQAVQSESPILNSEPVTSPTSKAAIAPKANNQIEKFYQIFKDMSFEISFVDALILMPKFASTLKALIGNKEKLSEMARTSLNEHCSAVLLKKLPDKLGDLELVDRSISCLVGVAEEVYVKVGSFHFPADFVVIDFDVDPRVPLILERSFLKTERALIDVFEVDEPLEVELKDLPPHLEYAFLEGDDKLPVIIAKDFSVEEKSALITVLKSHKRAIAWKLSDIKDLISLGRSCKSKFTEDFVFEFELS
nr:hypothetical protein [Tanacetum cinerariifolium]